MWLARAGRGSIPEGYLGLLPQAELQTCNLIRHPRQRHCALLSRVLLRTALSQYGAMEPSRWRLVADSRGKPRISNPGVSLCFNLSHSHEWVGCAIGENLELGLDVEHCAPRRNLLRLARRHFSPLEARELAELGEAEQCERFYDYWTLKEAWLKATGRGLGGGLDSVVFQPGADGSLTHRAASGEIPAEFECWDLEPGYRLSLCREVVTGGRPNTTIFELKAPLIWCERSLEQRFRGGHRV